MGDVVNLRRVRKDRARLTREREAEANRLKFGRTKAERQFAAKENDRQDKSVESHKLERDDSGSS